VLFLSSSESEWVLRGSPLLPGQFHEERFFVRALHEQSVVPVPWPYLLDEDLSIFGWSYVIMPRLPGLDVDDPAVAAQLSASDRRQIAVALGTTLADMQAATWPVPGRYDPATDGIEPFPDHVASWQIAQVQDLLGKASAQTPALTTAADRDWVERVIAQAEGALRESFRPCLVMADFKDQNVVVQQSDRGAEWRVSGVFDLMGSYIGDGEAALARQIARECERTPRHADAFVRAYLGGQVPRPGFGMRLGFHMLAERMAIWEWAQREGLVWWQPDLTLRGWIAPFVNAARAVANRCDRARG
jgi:hygromycin-B 7''-O-kinase